MGLLQFVLHHRNRLKETTLREFAVKQATIIFCKKAFIKGLDAWDFISTFISIIMLDLDTAEFVFEEGDDICDIPCGLGSLFSAPEN